MHAFLLILSFLWQSVQSIDSSESITYFGWKYSPQTFHETKQAIYCMGHNGSWVERSYPPYYFANAVPDNPYVTGNCELTGHSEGNRYEWVPDPAVCKLRFHDDHESTQHHHNHHHHRNLDNHPTEFQTLEKFTTLRLCEIMNGRNMMIVGDSLNSEFSYSLFDSLHSLGWTYNNDVDYSIQTIPCPYHPSFQISMRRNDRLSTDPIPLRTSNQTENDINRITPHGCLNCADGNFLHCPWFNLLPERNISLLFLNRGAHYESSEKMLPGIRKALMKLRTEYPHIAVIIRDTPFGHVNTHDVFLSKPLTEAPKPHNDFNYELFEEQNHQLYHLISTEFPEVIYLDFFTPTIRRQDSHRDALHYCIPGPTLMWVQTLFFNTLVLLQRNALHSSSSSSSATSSSASSSLASLGSEYIDGQGHECGHGWHRDFYHLHNSNTRFTGDGQGKRYLVYMITSKEIDKVIVGLVSAFYTALLSGRVLAIESDSQGLSLDGLFNHKHVNLTAGEEVRSELFHGDSVYTVDVTSFSVFLEKDIGNIYQHSHAIVKMTTQVGFSHSLVTSPRYKTLFEHYRMPPHNCFACAFHFLLHPTNSLANLMRPIHNIMSQRVPTIMYIGISVMLPSPVAAETTIESVKRTGYHIENYLRCAQSIESIIKSSHSEVTEVLWYVMSNSVRVKREIASKYNTEGKTKVLTLSSSSPSVGVSASIDDETLNEMADILLMSLSNYFVMSHKDSHGKISVWLSQGSNSNNSTYNVDPHKSDGGCSGLYDLGEMNDNIRRRLRYNRH